MLGLEEFHHFCTLDADFFGLLLVQHQHGHQQASPEELLALVVLQQEAFARLSDRMLIGSQRDVSIHLRRDEYFHVLSGSLHPSLGGT